MAAELPIVGTDVAGIKEIINPEHTGVVVPPKSPNSLAKAMVSVISSDTDTIGKRALERVNSNFSIEQMASSHENLYENLVE